MAAWRSTYSAQGQEYISKACHNSTPRKQAGEYVEHHDPSLSNAIQLLNFKLGTHFPCNLQGNLRANLWGKVQRRWQRVLTESNLPLIQKMPARNSLVRDESSQTE